MPHFKSTDDWRVIADEFAEMVHPAYVANNWEWYSGGIHACVPTKTMLANLTLDMFQRMMQHVESDPTEMHAYGSGGISIMYFPIPKTISITFEPISISIKPKEETNAG
jgi:hypothetical protein